ncbi:MAG: ABC transporter ATP-binding protein [Lachnospiraceae bacterium]|nr:ABC transporter ATP-binding protein [Lachnospiraceae bacterium]
MAKRNTYFQDEVIERKIDIKQLGRTLRYVIPYKKVFMLVGVLMFVSSLVSLIPSLILKHITDVVIPNKDYADLAYMVLSMVLLAVLEISITFVHSRLMGKTGHSLIAEIRQDIFYKLQELPFDYFDNRPNGKIVVRVTEYVNGLANFFTNFVMMFVIYLIKIVVVTVLMLVLSPKLTLIVFLTVIPMMVCVFVLRYSIRKLFGAHRAKVSNRTAFLVESIMGEKIVKNYNRAEMNEEIYREVHNASLKQWRKIYLRNELNTPIVEFFWNAGTLCLYAVALGMLLNGDSIINVGLMTTFTAYMSQFSGPLTMIAFIIQNLAQVSSNLEQVFDTIDYPVTIHDMEGSEELQKVEGVIDFNQVTFAYEEGVNILENFDLHVKPGETIALVGPTGAGKTTVINMLTRFYDVQKGSVTIDGKDVREVTLSSLRKEVGVLMQDPFIFKGTVMENIRYGRPDATDEECIAAAKAIYADRCIDKLKDGYQHMLDERGEGLSAGEKQLISFARIILKNPSVIILDEATSSIDTETEKLIKQALDVIIKDKTAFIVAHRLSTIRNADRILYIANKGIAEQGTHEELMEKKGLYYALNV